MNTTNPKLSGRLSKVSIVPYDSEKHGRVGIGQSDYADGFIDGQKELIKELEMAKYHQVQTILSDLLAIVGEDEPEEYYTKRMGRMVAHPHKENWAKNKLRAQLKRAIRAYVGVES